MMAFDLNIDKHKKVHFIGIGGVSMSGLAAEEALRVVRDSADIWNINPNDVGIMGFSAGGHLASTIATHSAFDVRLKNIELGYSFPKQIVKKMHLGTLRLSVSGYKLLVLSMRIRPATFIQSVIL